MTPLGRYYYSNVKIGRIKFHKDNKESKEETSSMVNDKAESSPCSSQKKSSLTLSTSHNFRLTLEKANSQEKSKATNK